MDQIDKKTYKKNFILAFITISSIIGATLIMMIINALILKLLYMALPSNVYVIVRVVFNILGIIITVFVIIYIELWLAAKSIADDIKFVDAFINSKLGRIMAVITGIIGVLVIGLYILFLTSSSSSLNMEDMINESGYVEEVGNEYIEEKDY